MTLRVFISYAKEDSHRAVELYDRLQRKGFDPWMDVKRLLPGQNWEAEIQRAFESANVILLLLSKTSVSKRGFVQREANEAIDRLRYKQPTDIYVIPILLESCEVPGHIAGRLQYVDITQTSAWDQVSASLRLAAEQQSIALIQGVAVGPYLVTTAKLEEKWAARPGHDIKIEYPCFTSEQAPAMAPELSLFFSGRAVDRLISSRQKPWQQNPDIFQEPSDYATNVRWESYSIAHATERFVSVLYSASWYGAGAAHGQIHFETYNFCYEERVLLIDLTDFFIDGHWQAGVERISEVCLRELRRMYWERTGEKPDEGQEKWFKSGAGPKLDNFRSFTATSDHFTFLFPPYQVSSYAMGTWQVDVSYFDLLDLLRPDGIHERAQATA